MALVDCSEPECNSRVSSLAEVCPNCGAKLECQTKSEGETVTDRYGTLLLNRGMKLNDPSLYCFMGSEKYCQALVCLASCKDLVWLYESCKDWIDGISLQLMGMDAVHQSDLERILKLPNLTYLDLAMTDLSYDCLYTLGWATNLKCIHLPAIVKQASLQEFLHLERLVELLELQLPVTIGRQHEFDSTAEWLEAPDKVRDHLRRSLPNTKVT